MNDSNAKVQGNGPVTEQELASPVAHRQRPSFRLSDIWRSPLHDFPMRDEILYQCLPLSAEADVLEVGPGSGFTAFRLSREVRQVTVLDISAEAIRQLQARLQAIPNLRFLCADVCAPNLKERISRQFHTIFGLAVLDLLPDPAAALKNLAAVLAPGGRLLMQFPNYPPPRGPGVTCFHTRQELDRLLEAAGFESWAVFALQLRPYARFLFEQFHDRPMQLLWRLRNRNGHSRTLTYEETWTFRYGQKLEPLKYVMHAGWALLSAALHLGGDSFQRVPLGDQIVNNNLLLLARR